MAYIGAEPDGMGKAQRFTYTATGTGTAVTADDDGIPIGYTAGQVSVYLNGVKQVIGTGKDVTATDGSTITFASAYAVDDVIEVVALSIFSATTVEGTALISTGETGGSKFLREDGDGTSSWQTVTEYNDDVVQTNIALLAFKTATNGSLAKYNLQDQVIDEYTDATGIDATPSNNHVLVDGVYSSYTDNSPTGGTTVTGVPSGYSAKKFTANGSLTVGTAGDATILVVGGGGSGGADYGGGGGAGGVVYDAVLALTPNTYDAVIGDGGAGATISNSQDGNSGGDTTWTINSGITQFTAKGGGGGGGENRAGTDGGSGGGGSYTKSGGSTTQSGTSQGVTPNVNIGYDGATGGGTQNYNPAGGGGAGSVGEVGNGKSGDGGTGVDYSAIFGTAVGDSGWFASGGGGGFSANGLQVLGTASSGGGSDGATVDGGDSTAATDGTGGGSGGGGSNTGDSADGGSGIIVVRWADSDFLTYTDLTLQSTDTAAEAVPTKADMVIRMEDAAGTASLDTSSGDIKAYVSRDSGSTFIQGTLVDEGHWGDGTQRILAFHDLSFTGASGTAMCYKITTHNQAVGKQTKIHATSIGWR